MATRLVIPRLSEGTTQSADAKIDAPTVGAIRIVFGVGRRARAEPTDDAFAPVYTVSVPVFSLGGLDSDGVYEFDATSMLRTLQAKAVRRSWGVRLELDIVQSANTVAAADVHVVTAYEEGGPSISLSGEGTMMGGARLLTIVSSLALTPDAVGALGSKFTIQLRDAGPGESASVESAERTVELNLTRYEFQG